MKHTLLYSVMMNRAEDTGAVGSGPIEEPADPTERLAARWARAAEDERGAPEGVAEGDLDEGTGEEVDEVVDQDDEAEQDAADGEDESERDADDGDTFSTLEELLEAGAADPAALKVRVKVAGEERDVTLEEAIRGYQRQADYDRLMQGLKSERESLRQKEETGLKQLQERVQEVDFSANLVQQQLKHDLEALHREYNSVDWGALRVDSPDEYAARVADFQRMEAQLRQRAEGTLSQMAQTRQKVQEHVQRTREAYYQEQGRMLRSLPGWESEDKARENLNNVFSYLSKRYGANDEELKSLADHRIFDLARKARAYDELMESGAQNLGRERDPKTGRFLKPSGGKKRTLTPGGSRRPVATQSARKAEGALRDRLKETGSMDAASAVLAHRFRQRQTR